jgi:hypothetical protein
MESMGRTLSSVHLPILDELSDLLIYEMKKYVEVFNQTPSSNWTNRTTNDEFQHFGIQLPTNLFCCSRILKLGD